MGVAVAVGVTVDVAVGVAVLVGVTVGVEEGMRPIANTTLCGLAPTSKVDIVGGLTWDKSESKTTI